jgi:hypothetical protein
VKDCKCLFKKKKKKKKLTSIGLKEVLAKCMAVNSQSASEERNGLSAALSKLPASVVIKYVTVAQLS